MNKYITALGFTSLLLLSVSAHAGTMTFSIQEKMQKLTEPSILQKEIHKKSVTLFPRAFSYKEGSTEEVYNFQSDTYYKIDHDKKEILNIPLHAFPAFMQQEKKSRIGSLKSIAQLIKAGTIKKADVPEFSAVDLEMELGSTSNSPLNPKIKSASKGNVHTFSYDGKVINTYQEGADEIPANLMDSYERFLLYKVPAQAVVRSSLISQRKIFAELTYSFRSLTPLRLDGQIIPSGAETSPDDDSDVPALPSGYRTSYSAEQNLNELVTQLKSGNIQKPRLDSYKTRMEQFTAGGKYMEAAFTFFEATTIFNPDEIATLNDHVKQLYGHANQAPDLLSMTQAISSTPKNEAELLRAENTLNRLLVQYPDAAILNLYLANHINTTYGRAGSLSMEQNQKLEHTPAMIMQALKKSPWMPNAWVDLGDAYYLQFDPFSAMRCWMTAQELAPNASMVSRTTEFKEALEKNLPEYF